MIAIEKLQVYASSTPSKWREEAEERLVNKFMDTLFANDSYEDA